jgi:hypothetical protein
MAFTLQIKLHTRLAMIAQIRGSNRLQFLPQQACKSECPLIQFTLLEGEIGQFKEKENNKNMYRLKTCFKNIYFFKALFNPKRWDLEYQPGGDSLNLGFIIQGEID